MVFRKRTRVDVAKKMFLERISPIERTEKLSIEDARGRVMAEAIVSEIDVPDHRRAAMDGYAVRADDTTGASQSNPVLIREGARCVRVHTGSPMPQETDAVVMIEDTLPGVEIRSAVHPNKHVSLIGEDVAKGDTVFGVGHRLRGCDIAMLATLGISHITVYERPTVAVIPTGSELVPRGKSTADGIRETNGLMVGLYVEKWGGIPIYRDIVVDDPDLIEKEILACQGYDAIILCGGTSVGARDYVPGAIESTGVLLVHGVALSPGKPTALGIVGDTRAHTHPTLNHDPNSNSNSNHDFNPNSNYTPTPVLSLPGYPVACLIALSEFGRPAVMRLGRIPAEPRPRLHARISAKIASKIGYVTYTRVRVADGVAHPVMTSGAGILSSVTGSDGFVIIKEELEGLDSGDPVDVVWIE